MAVNYVKFQRGSEAAYNKLALNNQLDENTLYFIYPNDGGLVGKLYLGSRLISGGDTILSAASLDDLADVIVAGAGTDCFLVKDGNNWVAKDLSTVASMIKASMGEIAAPANVFQVELLDTDANDIAAINRVVASSNKTLAAGDMAIVKELIVGNATFSRTGYVYNGSEWLALDGNYNAENVYFDENLTVTAPVGIITQTMINNGNGAATWETEGKNVKEALASLFAEAKDPSVTQPTASLSVSGNNGEVGSTYALPTATLTVTDGSYTYGSKDATTSYGAEDTGITFAINDVTVTETTTGVTGNSKKNTAVLGNNGKVQLTASGSDARYIDGDKVYSFSGTAKYTTSDRVPINNLGATVPKKQIGYNSNTNEVAATVALTVGGTSSATFTGWRKMFMGTIDEYNNETGVKTPQTITSAIIRSLTGVSEKVSTTAKEFTAPVGATKIIVACPKGYVISKCEYYTMSWETIANFAAVADVDVADARGGENGLTAYNVYAFDHANPSGFEAATKYRVTLKKG